MLCPSCNKFAAYDTSSEPEVSVGVESELALPFDEKEGANKEDRDHATARVTGDCRIVITAECCGDELKEASFEIDQELEIVRGEGCECDLTELSVEAEGEISDRTESTITKTKKDGTVVVKQVPYRYQKRYYGAQLNVVVTCECGKTRAEAEWHDECQASSMDELV